MKKLLINSLQQSFLKFWIQIQNNFSRIGTHVHIGLTVVIFIMFLLNNHNTQKDRQNASRIDSVAKDITVKWQAMAKNDSVSKLELDSIHTEQAHYNALVAANDEKFSEIEKELEKLKENQKKFNERIDKASPEELAGFYRTRKLPSK